MGSYRTIFPKRHTFLTVIHAEDETQVVRNVITSKDYGADGTFLINHSASPEALFRMYAAARKAVPEFWIGLNVLGVNPLQALKRMPPSLLDGLQGLWADDPGMHTGLEKSFKLYRENEIGWQGLYFGSVAFKYQDDYTEDPFRAARLAVTAEPFMDVVTTSGAKTGTPPSAPKIKGMKDKLDDSPLAIASGMTIENVNEYLPFIDCFLVSTGVSNSFTELSATKVMAFHDKCEAYDCRSR